MSVLIILDLIILLLFRFFFLFFDQLNVTIYEATSQDIISKSAIFTMADFSHKLAAHAVELHVYALPVV